MKRTLISIVILIVVTIGVVLTFSKTNVTKKEEGKIYITTSIYPVYDFTKEVAGDKAIVAMLLPPGVEIHDYDPSTQDITTIQDSDIFFYTSNDLEPWVKKVTSGLKNKDNIKSIADNIELIDKEEFEKEYIENTDKEEKHEEHEKYDTHIWLDPTKSIIMVRNIQERLSEADPQNSTYYKENADNYIKKLQELDMSIISTVKKSSNNKLAFGGPFAYAYFIKRYNLEFVSAYDSCGEGNEPSVKKMYTVIEEVKKDNLPVIFYKELSSANFAKRISEETGAKCLEFNSLHTITKAQLQSGENYLSIMYHNLENVKQALN